MAAAVVNEPAGSAKTEHWNGGTRAFFAASRKSSANDRILAADEEAGANAVVRGTREDRVLHQRHDFLWRHVDVGDDDLVAGISGHVHVERTHMLLRRQHMKDWGSFAHFKSSPYL